MSSALASRLRPFGFLFDKSLNDLIRGLRARKEPEAIHEYLRVVVAECREAVRSPQLDTKCLAVLKLTYLEMLGIDMSWAGFHVLEVMASPKFEQKRIGYLAAMQSFRGDPELLMLATNLLKTDLASASKGRQALALSGLAAVVTPLLAADVCDDLLRMLSHSQPYIRKKAVLAVHKVVLQYPEALDACLPRLADKLDETEDPSVVAAAVNVIGELAQQGPQDTSPFVAMSPRLYALLLSSPSNWTVIKLLKLFAHLTRWEPRLKTKLLPAICDLLDSKAPSLMYESLACVLNGNMLTSEDTALARSIAAKLRHLLAESDPNLKYVAFQALERLTQVNPEFTSADPQLPAAIQACLGDHILMQDPAIRTKVLGVLQSIVDDDNLYDIVLQLVALVSLSSPNASSLQPKANSNGEYYSVGSADCALAVIKLCSMRNYEYLPDFAWYLDMLVEICRLQPSVGADIGSQLVNVAVRVRAARGQAVAAALRVIDISGARSSALWVIGEYASTYEPADDTGGWPAIIREVLRVSGARLGSSIRLGAETAVQTGSEAAAITAVAKLVAHYSRTIVDWAGTLPQLLQTLDTVVMALEAWSSSNDVEVQERSCQFLELFRLARHAAKNPDNGGAGPVPLVTVALPSLFSEFDMSPLAAGSQSRIMPPENLDLDTPLVEVYGSSDIMDSASEPESDSIGEPEPIADPVHDPARDTFYIPSGDKPLSSGTDVVRAVSEAMVKDSPAASIPRKPPKPAKVKVEVAADQPVGVDGSTDNTVSLNPERSSTSSRPQTKPPKDSSKRLFQVGFRHGPSEIIEASPPAPAPETISVRHKHTKKKGRKSVKSLKHPRDAAADPGASPAL